jgi:hypothetical protein
MINLNKELEMKKINDKNNWTEWTENSIFNLEYQIDNRIYQLLLFSFTFHEDESERYIILSHELNPKGYFNKLVTTKPLTFKECVYLIKKIESKL